MSCCSHDTHAHHNCCGAHPPFPGFLPPWMNSGCGQYVQPICSSPAQYTDAGTLQGATLVIYKIALEACGEQSCTPRTYNICITGLEPGTYCIEELHRRPNQVISTLTGPVCGHQVTVTNSYMPTVVTICSRRRLCALCQGYGCGCNTLCR